MKGFDVIAYTADADIWCPDCAEKAYGIGALGICPECRSFTSTPRHGEFVCRCGWTGSGKRFLDNEGNEVHPIFASNEHDPAGEHCGVCGREVWEPESTSKED